MQAILLEAEFYNLQVKFNYRAERRVKVKVQGLIKTCRQLSQTELITQTKPSKTAYRVLMCSELDLTTTLASLR